MDVLYSSNATVGHWIVQKLGSAKVLHLGQEPTFDLAKQAAKEFIEEKMREQLRISDDIRALPSRTDQSSIKG